MRHFQVNAEVWGHLAFTVQLLASATGITHWALIWVTDHAVIWTHPDSFSSQKQHKAESSRGKLHSPFPWEPSSHSGYGIRPSYILFWEIYKGGGCNLFSGILDLGYCYHPHLSQTFCSHSYTQYLWRTSKILVFCRFISIFIILEIKTESHNFLFSICYNVLFWLQYMKKIWPREEM